MGTSLLRAVLASLTLTVVAPLAACGGGQRPTTAMKPIEERRARGVIEKALVDNGMRPATGRVVKLNGGVELVEDMAIEGEKYGIAYLTEPEAAKAGSAVPAYQRESEQLRLVPGQGGTITLIVYEQNYRYDAGDTHATNAVTAEKRLSRDVADFVLHVVKQRKGGGQQ
jgi:hypothetical protein